MTEEKQVTAIPGTSQNDGSRRQSPYTMTEEILLKRVKRGNKGRFKTQLCCAVTASLAALSFGAVMGWSNSATRYFVNPVHMYNFSEEDYAWIVSLMPLGCSVGIVPSSYGINKFGPKNIMILQTPLYVLTILVMVTVKTFNSYLLCRFFSGFLSISYLMGGERLLTDSVHRGYLPLMTVFYRSSVLLGVLLSYMLGHFVSTIWLTIVCAIIPIVNIFFLFISHESPVFLYDKSEKKAEAALRWYRGTANIYMAMQSIRKDAEIRKLGAESNRYMLFSKVVMKALLIIIGLNFFRVFSGYYAFMFYNLLLWSEFKFAYDEVTDATIFGSCLFFSNLISNLFRNYTKFGVRKLLIISCILVALALTSLTVYVFLYEERFSDGTVLNWLPLASANAYVFFYELGLSVYPDILLYDYLPYQVYVTAKNITQVVNWFQIFLLTKYIITVRNHAAHFVAFGMLTVISYISIYYCNHYIIETKGKNLMQIQIAIGGNPIGNRGAYRYRMSGAMQGLYVS